MSSKKRKAKAFVQKTFPGGQEQTTILQSNGRMSQRMTWASSLMESSANTSTAAAQALMQSSANPSTSATTASSHDDNIQQMFRDCRLRGYEHTLSLSQNSITWNTPNSEKGSWYITKELKTLLLSYESEEQLVRDMPLVANTYKLYAIVLPADVDDTLMEYYLKTYGGSLYI